MSHFMQDYQEHRYLQETADRDADSRMTRPDRSSLAGFSGELFWPDGWNLEALLDRIESDRRIP